MIEEEKMVRFKLLMLFFVAAAIIAACSGKEEPEVATESCEASVTGKVTFPGRTTLPEDAVIHVMILDTSLPDEEENQIIGDQIIKNPGQLPVSYEVCYDQSKIQEDVTYSIEVEIRQMPSFMPYGANEALHPVITESNPTENVDIVVTPADF